MGFVDELNRVEMLQYSSAEVRRMRNLSQMLRDSDRGRLQSIADSWGVDVRGLQDDELRQALQETLLEEKQAKSVWFSLSDEQRGALQTLLSAERGEMSKQMFGRLYGEITRLGLGQIQRDKPQQSQQPAQALYYRGLIGEAYERDSGGTRLMVYVPEDLRKVLPARQTAYAADLLSGGEVAASLEPIAEVERREPADTTIVDDLTTLLAFLQRYPESRQGDGLTAEARKQLRPFLLQQDERRLYFILALATSAKFLEGEGGNWNIASKVARPWLQLNRHLQVKQLAQAWRDSPKYRELSQLRELRVDHRAGDMPNHDFGAARANAVSLLGEKAPPQDWWLVEDFIELVKLEQPEFQRPRYDRWYIQNESGEYLSGFEHWDAIEGRLLEFLISGPMHWLGLMDLAEQAARLTTYGRAFLGHGQWPDRVPPIANIDIEADGTLLVPRRVGQLTRFQLARFCEWGPADDPFPYRLTAASLKAAQEKGITLEQIRSYLLRALQSEALPALLLPLFSQEVERNVAEASLEERIILHTTSSETLDYILENPALRRYLTGRLGPQAAVVLPRKEAALRRALMDEGIVLPEAKTD